MIELKVNELEKRSFSERTSQNLPYGEEEEVIIGPLAFSS